MAKSQLYAIAKYAIELLQLIKDGDPLDAWVQAKITKAADYVDAVQHYLEGEEYLDANQGESEEELDEGIGTIALGVASGLALLKALKFIGGKVLKGIAHNVPLPKEKLLEVVSLVIRKSMQDGSSGINMFKIIGLKKFLEEKIEDGSFTTIKQIKQVIEKAAKLDDSDLNEKLDEDYEPRTKEDLVFQYLRDAWQFGALKGKDINPDEELSTMADSLLANLPDYDSAELGEAKKRGHSTIQTDLDNVKAKMRELAKQYSAGDKSVLAQLKDLNDEKKALEKELINVVSKIGAGQEYKGEVDEVVQLDEIKAVESAEYELSEAQVAELLRRTKDKTIHYLGQEYKVLDVDSAGTFTVEDPKTGKPFYINRRMYKLGNTEPTQHDTEEMELNIQPEDE